MDFTARNVQVIKFGDVTYSHSLNQVHGRTGTSLSLWTRVFSWNILSLHIIPFCPSSSLFPISERAPQIQSHPQTVTHLS